MAEVTTKVWTVGFESFFAKAVIFKDARCDQVSQKFLEAFASYGLTPTQIVLRSGDQNFNYDLSFTLFKGNGTFRISAEKLDISLQNAVSEKDLEVVEDCIARIYEHIPLPEINTTTVSATAHATFDSIEAMQHYLGKYANAARQVVSGGTIAYILVQNWGEEIRLLLDKSLAYPTGVFLGWTTIYRGSLISRGVLNSVKGVFEQAAASLNLTFSKVNLQ